MKRIADLYKNAYSGLSPAMWWLSLVMLVNRAGTMVVPFMTLYLTQARHYSITKAGLVMSIFGIGAVCGGFLGGKLTDRFGFYNIQLSALLCGGVMFMVLGQISNYTSICICTFVLALLNDSFRPANATAIAQYSHEGNRTRCYSLNRLAINLGWAAGGVLGGFIASRNYQLLFWIDGITNISAAILLRLLLSPSKNNATPAQAEKHPKGRPAYKDGIYIVFILLTIMYGLCFFQIFSTQPVFFKTILNLTPAFIGGIMGFNGIMIAAFEMTLVFVLERRQKNNVYIMLGTMLAGFSFVMFNIFPGAKMLVVCSTIVITVGEMLSMPFMNSFWISRTNPANRGQHAGLYTAAWSIAQVLGPYIGSRIAETQGFHTLWWATGGLSVLTAVGFLQLRQSKV